ncbi:MAG: FHA domain-containing protein [Thermomicrobiales bacterium]
MSGLPADWFLLLLRLLFVFLLYFFLYQLFRVQLRQLLSAATQPESTPARSHTPHPTLVVTSQDAPDVPAGATFLLQPVSTVGRHPDSTVHIADASTSSAHAEIRLSGGQWWIADLDSTNGTFVNGTRADRPTRIEDGDVVQFGRVEMAFVRS